MLETAVIGRMWSANLWHARHIKGTVDDWVATCDTGTESSVAEITEPLAITPDHRILLDGHHKYLAAVKHGQLLVPVLDDPSDPRYPDGWRWLRHRCLPATPGGSGTGD
jgi:hypothetical protein